VISGFAKMVHTIDGNARKNTEAEVKLRTCLGEALQRSRKTQIKCRSRQRNFGLAVLYRDIHGDTQNNKTRGYCDT
jgi:hypothetical protein